MNVAIIGTGNYGVSIASRLIRNGNNVLFGSRWRTGQKIMNVDVVSIESALQSSKIVILAIPSCKYVEFCGLYKNSISAGSIIIDVSNRISSEVSNFCNAPPINTDNSNANAINDNFFHKEKMNSNKKFDASNAEFLQIMLPHVCVIKAFNTIPAHAVKAQNEACAGRNVLICGDDRNSKMIVFSLVSSMGLIPIDNGMLENARDQEILPHKFFLEWRFGIKVAVVSFLISTMYIQVRDINKAPWFNFFYFNLNPIVACTSLIMFLMALIPGALATTYKLYKNLNVLVGPKWLISWLEARKSIGVFSFFFATFHVLLTLMSYKLVYIAIEYKSLVYGYKFQLSIFFGLVSLGIFVILALATIPSVDLLFSWKEHDFLHSKLGFLALVTIFVHVTMIFLSWNEINPISKWPHGIPPFTLPLLALSSVIIITKLLYLLPPLSTKINATQ